MVRLSPRLLPGLAALALVLQLTLSALPVAAQSGNQSGQALEIAPPVLNLSGNPGQTVKSELSLRDVSPTNLIVTGEVNDFTASADEDGTPKILLDEGETSPYSIKEWVAPLPRLNLKPREIRKLPVSITIPKNAAPGGYYGVVRFTATPPELEDTGVSLSASLGALILLRVNGEAKEGISIAEFSTTTEKDDKKTSFYEFAPVHFLVRMKNTGTIHEQPAGQITVTDMFGKKVATVNVNLPPRNILPQSIRKFNAPLDSSVIGNKILFGRYTANLKVTYGANKQTVTSQLSFWVIPYRVIGIAIGAMIITFFALRFMIRRYNRHIINQAQKGSGSKSRRK